MIATYPPVLGGVQTVVSELAKQFIQKGHDVRVITNRFPRNLKSEETMEGVFRDLVEDNIPSGDCPYGDGKSAERITKILIEELKL